MSQYKLDCIDLSASRTELHDLLGLSGAEISCNNLPAGVSVPFVHAHKQNEKSISCWKAKADCMLTARNCR